MIKKHKKIFVDGKLIDLTDPVEHGNIVGYATREIMFCDYKVKEALLSLHEMAKQPDADPLDDPFAELCEKSTDYAAAAKWLEANMHLITVDTVEIEDGTPLVRYVDELEQSILHKHPVGWPVLKMAIADAFRAQAESVYRTYTPRRGSELEKIRWQLPPYLETKEKFSEFCRGLEYPMSHYLSHHAWKAAWDRIKTEGGK